MIAQRLIDGKAIQTSNKGWKKLETMSTQSMCTSGVARAILGSGGWESGGEGLRQILAITKNQ